MQVQYSTHAYKMINNNLLSYCIESSNRFEHICIYVNNTLNLDEELTLFMPKYINNHK